MIRIFGWVTTFLLALPLNATSAEISYQQDPIMGCFITLKGEIRKGDAEKFDIFQTKANEVFSSLTPEGFSVGHNNDIKIKKRLCLESPGGSLSEAVKIAKIIYGNWGTAVGKGKTCESACSVIFMAGSVSPEDDRGTIAQRILHPLGRLGFHAPSLRIAEGEYSANTVSKAYDIALKGIGQIYAIAGYIKFPPSLIGEMIATPPNEMLYIETIGQAARWHITVAPSVDVLKVEDLAVINACNNHYLFKAEIIELNGLYTRNHKIYYDYAEPEIENNGEDIDATLDGFDQEAASICRLSIQSFELKEPPLPTNFLGWVGIGEDGGGVEIYPSLFFGPSTNIASLAKVNDSISEKIEVKSLSKDVRKSEGRCYVFSGRKLVDSEPCSEIKEFQFQRPVYVLTNFIWPSGGKTVLEASGSEGFDGNTINGVETEIQIIDKHEIKHKYFGTLNQQAALDKIVDWEANCWDNSATDKTFCFQQYFQESHKFR